MSDPTPRPPGGAEGATAPPEASAEKDTSAPAALPPPSPPGVRTSFARTSALLVAATLMSRLIGFFRDMVIAAKFGANGLTDAYNVANSLPNFLNGVLQGGLSSVVVPTVSPHFGRGDLRRAYGLVNALALYAGVVSALLVLAVTLLAPQVVSALAPGMSHRDVAAGARLARILIWTVAFGVYFYLGAAALVADDRYFYMSVGPIFMSGSATALLLAVRHPPIVLLAVGLLIGSVLQFAFVAVPNLRHWRHYPPLGETRAGDPEVRRMLRRSVPALVSGAVGQVNAIVDRWVGSLLVPGSITEVTLANRVAQVPLGLFGYAISNASFPALARAYEAGETERVRDLLARDLRVVLLLTVPVMAEMVVLAYPIASAAYRHGHLTPAAARVIGAALVWYALCLVPFGVRTVLNRGFFLTGATRILANMSVVLVLLNAAGDFLFAKVAGMGAPGLAFGTMVDQWLSIFATFYYLWRVLPATPVRAAADAFWRAAAASVPLAVASRFAAVLLARVPYLVTSTLGRIALVAGAALAGAAVGAAALWLVRYPGLDELGARVRRALRARG